MGSIVVRISMNDEYKLVFSVLGSDYLDDDNIPQFTLSKQGFFTMDIEPADSIMGTPPLNMYDQFKQLVEAEDTVEIAGKTYTNGEIRSIVSYWYNRSDSDE